MAYILDDAGFFTWESVITKNLLFPYLACQRHGKYVYAVYKCTWKFADKYQVSKDNSKVQFETLVASVKLSLSQQWPHAFIHTSRRLPVLCFNFRPAQKPKSNVSVSSCLDLLIHTELDLQFLVNGFYQAVLAFGLTLFWWKVQFQSALRVSYNPSQFTISDLIIMTNHSTFS